MMMKKTTLLLLWCALWTTTATAAAAVPWDCGGANDMIHTAVQANCLDVNNDWNTLRNAVNNAKNDDVLFFCPFAIVTTANAAPLQPSRSIALICQTKGSCLVSGSGRMVINHARAQVYLWGFTFSNLVEATAIHMRQGTTAESLLICHSTFANNHDVTRRGAAIRTERDTSTKVQYSLFTNNTASRGGAIYSRGNLDVLHSIWKHNMAAAGQGNDLAMAKDAKLMLEGNEFQADGNPMVFVEWKDTKRYFTNGGGNTVTVISDVDDSACYGVYNRVGLKCLEFDIVVEASPSATPSIAPISVPSVSTTPTWVPSLAPSGPTMSPIPSSLPSYTPTLSPQPSITPPSTAPTISKQPVTTAPTPSYTPPDDDHKHLKLVDRRQPKGYYNFNVADPDFGPLAWHKINIDHNEYTRYAHEGLDVSKNECGSGKEQSPMQLHEVNHDCAEFHQIRARGGDWKNLTLEGEISYSITPSHLRLQIDSVNPRAPRADSPGGFIELYADHVEVTVPSLHVLPGNDNKKYDAEYSIYHVQGKKNRVLVLSVLVDASVNMYNAEFQKVLNAFEGVTECGAKRRLVVEDDDEFEFNDALDLDHDQFDLDDDEFDYTSNNDDEYAFYDDDSINNVDNDDHSPSNEPKSIPVEDERKLAEDAKIDGKFNLYNTDMVPSLYWYAYGGSLPRPPCSKIANWRVIDTPMQISHLQLLQLKRLLDGPCDNEGLGARTRPIIAPDKRDVWRCTRADYKSDCERFGRLCPAPDFP